MRKKFAFLFCAALLITAITVVKHDQAEASTSARQPPVSPGSAKRGASELSKPDPSTQLRILKNYGKLPLAFEENRGQIDPRVKFISRGAGYTLFLTADEAVLSLPANKGNDKRPRTNRRNEVQQSPVVGRQSPNNESEQQTKNATLRMKLVGADPTAPISGLDELPGKSNYFVGNDRKKWRTNISNYAKVKYTGVFPGVDLVYYGSQRQLEYDFLVAPDADPSPIQFSLAGVRKPVNKHRKGPVEIAVNGDLIVKMDGGEVQFHKPVAYQESGSGIRHFVEARYILGGGQQVSLAVGSYDRRRPLVIDPVLSYSTYLGPSGGVSSIAVDTSGNAYVTGGNTGTGFPTTPGAFQTTCPGGCFPAGAAFVSKLNATGSALVYSTYLDGSNGGGAFGEDIAVDSGGDAYVTGQTGSANFPITTGAFQTVCHACFGGNGSYQTGFVTKLNSTGSALLYSTFLGGSTREIAFGIALDPSDNAYTTGETWSSDFPVTAGSFQPIYQTGGDAFVTELNSAGSALIYSTYLGGANSEGVRIKVNSAGNAYAVGGTQSPSFPTTPGAFAPTCNKCGPGTDPGGHPLQDVFVTEFSTNGSALVYSTFLGGSDGDFPGGIALDSSGNVYVTGATYSNDFPVTPGAFQTACGGGSCSGELGDAFVSKLNSTGSALLYSTYLGGNSYDAGTSIAVDSSGDAYVGGLTTSLDFPVTSGAFQTQCNNCSLTNYVSDAFMSELNPSGSTLLYSTYLGGSNEDYVGGIALDANGNIYLGGGTISTDFPTTAGSYQPTATSSSVGAFVAKFAFGSTQSGSAASITPPNLDFGTVVIGAKSSSQDITLSSTGSAALSISTIGISGANSSDFSQTNNCGASVAPDTSCTITVTFSPTVTGVMAASVTISDNASNSPQSISLSGTGTDFSLSAATGSNCPSGGNCSTSATVTAGQAATYNLQVAPVSGFNGTVTLSCGDALAKSTCSVSPSSVTVNGTAASALAVTVTTTAASMLGPYSTPASRRPSGPPVLPALLVLVVALFIAESAAARNPRRRLVPALAILAMSLVWMVGCGGGSSSGGSAGTPSGTITVTGTSSGVNHSESLNLTVN